MMMISSFRCQSTRYDARQLALLPWVNARIYYCHLGGLLVEPPCEDLCGLLARDLDVLGV